MSDDQRYPSSFEGDAEFYESGWVRKLGRRLREEPLVPLGCLATCFALYQAAQSMKRGDHYQTNKMFRARIYAQGFTLLAILAGGIYYKDDRLKRAEYNKAITARKAQEKREAWIRELEIRDQEDTDWRERHEAIEKAAREAQEGKKTIEQAAREIAAREAKVDIVQAAKDIASKGGPDPTGLDDDAAKSMLDEKEWRRDGVVMAAVRDLWRRR